MHLYNVAILCVYTEIALANYNIYSLYIVGYEIKPSNSKNGYINIYKTRFPETDLNF